MARARKYWLMKSEPDAYGLDDLEREGTGCWDGVRNYQARNYMRDDMRVGDLVLFYHSNAKPIGVAGVARVSREAYPDHTALDPNEDHYDPKATEDDPIWVMVDLEFVERLATFVTREMLKADPALADMLVLARGQRLSIMPVEKRHFDRVCKLGRGTQ